ncbi:MAG: restriction endonuclease subunit S [Bacteroidota bacterium]
MSSSEWKKCRLSQLSERITKGTTPTTLGHPFVPTGINFIKAESILIDGRIDSSKFVFIDDFTHNKLKRSQLAEGDILFSMAGMVLGKSAVVRKKHLPANTNQALALIRLKTDKVNPFFVNYFMRQKEFFNYVNTSTGQSAQPNINLEEIGNLEIGVPEIRTQNRIVSILSALDDKIELNRQTNQTLEAIAQAIYKEWFVNFNFPEATGEMQDSELGPIPKGWRVGEYTNELNIVYGKNLPTVNLLPSGNPVFGGNGLIGFYDKYLYEDPQVIVACRGAASGKVNQSLPNSFVTNNSLVFEIPQKSKLKFTYLKQYCLNTDFTSFVSGSAQPQLTIESFKNAFLLIPKDQILRNFDMLILPVEEAIRENDIQSNCLIKIRDSLLPKLMSGEIEV